MNALRNIVALLFSVLVCAGCVTKTESVFTEGASPEKALQRRVELARQYIGDGNWEDAKRNLKIAAEIDPRNAEVHEAFALVYQSTGEFEIAEENFRTALRLDPDFSRARNNYAAFLFARGRFREAEEHLERVVEDSLYNARPRAFVNLGLCRLRLNETKGAEEAFVRALSMDERNSLALLEIALLRFDGGDVQAAEQYYTRYRKLTRRQPPRGLLLGAKLAAARGDRDAHASYVLALRNMYPDSAEYRAYLRSEESR